MTADFSRFLRKALAALQREKVRLERQMTEIRRLLATEVDDRRVARHAGHAARQIHARMRWRRKAGGGRRNRYRKRTAG